MRRKREEQVWSPDTLANYLRFVPPTLEEVELADATGESIAPSCMYLLPVWQKRLYSLTSAHLRKCLERAREEVTTRNAKRKKPIEGYTGQAMVASLGRFVNTLLAYAVNQNCSRSELPLELKRHLITTASEPRSA